MSVEQRGLTDADPTVIAMSVERLRALLPAASRPLSMAIRTATQWGQVVRPGTYLVEIRLDDSRLADELRDLLRLT